MSILENILKNTRQEVAVSKKTTPLEQLREMPGFQRHCFSLMKALHRKEVSIIAEIKKASPSKGVIRKNFDPYALAREYAENGASAISILTDKKYFQGNIRFISDVRTSVALPILRKDFIVDSYQLTEAKAFGADAVLLIAAALEPKQLHDLHDEANKLGLDCLVEVHDERELATLDLKQVKVVGINNRDLSDFTVDVTTTLRVAMKIPKGIIIVSESGISSRADIDHLAVHGIHAILVGESLLRAESPGKALQALLTPSREQSK
ncbi:MAG: indole-3-glycerol phosphate synthase TrpC [Bacteroidota bacterium]|jgi:indole-3-glycerol phosphate synthase